MSTLNYTIKYFHQFMILHKNPFCLKDPANDNVETLKVQKAMMVYLNLRNFTLYWYSIIAQIKIIL